MIGNGLHPRRAGATLLLSLGATLCLVLFLASGGRALAHAALVGAEPADGAVVARAPSTFTLTFSEPTSPLVLKLIRPDGSAAVLDRFALRDATLAIEAPKDLADGTYVLSWRVVSEDGHPVGGSSIFSIGAPSAGGPAPLAEAVDETLRLAIWAARTLLYVGLFIGVGGAFFLRWIGGDTVGLRRLLAALMLPALAASVLSVGLQGLDALALPLTALGSGPVWSTGFSTSYGASAVLAVAALSAGLIAASLKGWAGPWLAALALIGVGAALAASGHASAAAPQWLTRPAVFLHGVGIAFWAGALAPLASAMSGGRAEAGALLRRFSRAIPLALLPLIAAGLILAIVQLGRIDALWSTAYGRVLMAKLVLLVALFGLAALNRFRLTGPAEAGDAGARRRLTLSIFAELALVLAIFGVAALWRFTPPPRALAEAAAAPAALHIHAAKAMADLTITPGRAGPVAASITLMTGDFGPLDAKEVTLILSQPSVGIEPLRRPARKGAGAVWRIERIDLPQPGRWQARIDILISDFEIVKLDGTIDIRP